MKNNMFPFGRHDGLVLKLLVDGADRHAAFKKHFVRGEAVFRPVLGKRDSFGDDYADSGLNDRPRAVRAGMPRNV